MLISQVKKLSRTIYQLHKNNRIAFIGLQFGATSLFSMLLAIIIMDTNYKDYWDTTIYRTQTVDFNILANLLPTKLSIQLSQNDKKGIQETLDSNFGLFGIVVTDCKSDQKECLEQKILFASRARVESMSDGKQRLISEREYKGGWISILNEAQSPAQQLKKEELYLLLRNTPPLIQERKFKSPRDTNTPELKILNKGNIIGRVYIIRKPKPSFGNLLNEWIFSENKYIPSYYQAILFTSISSGIIVFILSSLLFEWQRKAEAAQRDLEDTQTQVQILKINLEDVQNNAAQTNQELENTRQELSTTQSQVQILETNLQDAQNNAAQTNQELENTRRELSEISQIRQHLIEQLQVANPEITSQELENNQALSEIVQREQQVIEQLRVATDNARRTNEELQNTNNELEIATIQFQDLLLNLREAESNVERTNQELEQNRTDLATTRSRVESLETNLEDISTKLTNATRREQELREELQAAQSKVDRPEADLENNAESWQRYQPNLNANNISDSQETRNASSDDQPQFRTVFDALESLRDEFSILEIGSDAFRYARDLNPRHAARVYEQLSRLSRFGYEYFRVRQTILGNNILLELRRRGIEASDESTTTLRRISRGRGRNSLQQRRFTTLNGRSQQMTHHIKIGENEVRIYFYFCAENNKVLIGYCGRHL